MFLYLRLPQYVRVLEDGTGNDAHALNMSVCEILARPTFSPADLPSRRPETRSRPIWPNEKQPISGGEKRIE